MNVLQRADEAQTVGHASANLLVDPMWDTAFQAASFSLGTNYSSGFEQQEQGGHDQSFNLDLLNNSMQSESSSAHLKDPDNYD